MNHFKKGDIVFFLKKENNHKTADYIQHKYFIKTKIRNINKLRLELKGIDGAFDLNNNKIFSKDQFKKKIDKWVND